MISASIKYYLFIYLFSLTVKIQRVRMLARGMLFVYLCTYQQATPQMYNNEYANDNKINRGHTQCENMNSLRIQEYEI